MTIEVTVPQIGESISEVQIVQWLKREGQAVDKDEALVSIDSEKATIEIPAPAAGVVGKIIKDDGEFANVGEVIATLEEPPAAQTELRSMAGQTTAGGATTSLPDGCRRLHRHRWTGRPRFHNKPGVADESAAEPTLEATRSADNAGVRGASGRLTGVPRVAWPPLLPRMTASLRDKPASGTPTATTDAAAARQEEVVPMSIIRRHIAQRLVNAQNQAALLTTFNEIDMSAVLELRKKYRDVFQEMYGVKLGLMSFFAKAAVEALKRFPALNAEIRGKSVVYRNYYDIGVAIGGGKGLVVPVLRDVQRMSFAEIERAIDAFAEKAAQNQLVPEDLEGGTFTISNGGIYGSLLSTPIVNPPQSGILGLHAIQERPVASDGQVVIRPMMYVALTYDHRLVDGREAVSLPAHDPGDPARSGPDVAGGLVAVGKSGRYATGQWRSQGTFWRCTHERATTRRQPPADFSRARRRGSPRRRSCRATCWEVPDKRPRARVSAAH